MGSRLLPSHLLPAGARQTQRNAAGGLGVVVRLGGLLALHLVHLLAELVQIQVGGGQDTAAAAAVVYI